MAFDLATAEPVEPKRFDPASAKPVTARSATWVPDSPETPIVAPAPARSVPAELARQVGLTVRAGVQNVAAIPNMLGDATGLRSSETVRNALTTLGLPEPEGRTERIVQDIAGGMGGAAGVAKVGAGVANAASPLARKIGEVLATRAGTQVASGASGGGAAGYVREEGGGPIAQLVAGVAGGMAPAAVPAAAAGVRAAARGGEAGRQKLISNIDTFEDAGAGTPSVGQGTESRIGRAIESTLAKLPGSAGPIAKKAELEAAGLGSKVDDMAATLTPRTGAAPAGRQISAGLEQFVDDFKASSGKLYDALDKHMPKDATVNVGNTRTALEKLNADIPGAPNLSKWFKNAKIQGIEGALDKDAPATQAQPIISQILGASGEQLVTGQTAAKVAGIPYEALKKLRSLVGNEISDSTIASDVPRSKWKPLYAALSKDMAAAAQAAGPKAEAAFVRANNYHRSGMQRLDDVLGPIMKKGDPEDVFKAALSGTQEGATTINGVMKSLPTESRKAVAATMLQRLGKATPGKQDAMGEAFSSETFLTNWNKLHPDSKRVLFSTLPDGMRSDLDKIAKVASNVREGSKVFANPSGTSSGVASVSAATAFGMALYHLNLPAMAAVPTGVGLAYGGGRLMTSPGFVHWLAGTTRAPVEQLPAQLNQLFQASLHMRGDERKEVREYVKATRAGVRAQQEQARQ